MNPGTIKSLHSRYNPRGEAERYINSLSINENTRYFVLVEPGLCYMAEHIKKRFPGAEIIALHAGELPPRYPETPPDAAWHQGAGITVQDFLENEIPDTEAAEIRLLEWRPALAAFGGAYRGLVEQAAEFIRRSDANARTIKAFGRKWFRNVFKNMEIINRALRPVPFSAPVIVTGAGPGLEDALMAVRGAGQSLPFILAASSSAAALEARGLFPDMVIATDGGNWARLHLYECFRGKRLSCDAAPSLPLAAALAAALPSQCEALPILPIADGSRWQALILNELGIPFISLPQRGTVGASALDVALALTSGEIFIAGMDLANRDIQTHARPYSFDYLMEEKAGRFTPLYSQTFGRSSLLKAGGSYAVYAGWFEKQLSSYPGRLFSLGRNNPVFNSLKTTSFLPASAMNMRRASFYKTVTVNKGACSAERAIAVLEKALKENARSEIYKELAALLFPGNPVPSWDELTGAVRELSGAYRGGRNG
jgi:hypothetical protein